MVILSRSISQCACLPGKITGRTWQQQIYGQYDFQAIGDNHPYIHEENSQIEGRIRTGAYNLWLDDRKEPNTCLSDWVNEEEEQVSQPFAETHKAHQATELAWLRPHLAWELPREVALFLPRTHLGARPFQDPISTYARISLRRSSVRGPFVNLKIKCCLL